MNSVEAVLLLMYFVILVIVLLVQEESDNFIAPNIISIYKNTKMNILGCFLSCILIIIFNPFISIVYIIYCVFRGIYWLCHIGRKNKK